ncbi:permease prefix domain 1-containing protein [Mesobacillus maritimus]|uniref:permease prefix domain 1-containing protein n=1 Tax=Mesobacillus maritimus TaxID=1643336 RepID=UPI00384FCAFF
MKSNFEAYVEKIVSQTDCTNEEKEDLFEELMVHLELSRGELMSQGMSEGEAELKAMKLFGVEEDIGGQIQQSMYPYRKELILTLSIGSILFTVSLYLLSLFHEGNAHIGWLLVSMVVSTILLLIAINQISLLNRRRWLNSLFITHISTSLFGYAIVSAMDHPAQLAMVIANWVIIFLALVLVYQTTIYESKSQKVLGKESKRLHQVNFILGIVTIGFCLFFIGGGLMLFGGFHLYMILMSLPLVLWICLYYGQMKLIHKHKRMAYLLAVLSVLINMFILLRAFLPLGVFK